MASTSIIVLRETLNRLTQDQRVRPDDPLLVTIRQQISDYEASQRRLEDDIQESFDPIFEMLNKHPHGERAAEEFLKRKKAEREKDQRLAHEKREQYERTYKENIEILLLKMKNAQQRAYSQVISAEVNKFKAEISKLVEDWNFREGTRCDVCSEIHKISVNLHHYTCHLDKHSYWDEGTDSGSGFGGTPPKFHPCTRNKNQFW